MAFMFFMVNQEMHELNSFTGNGPKGISKKFEKVKQ
jgi:hypothetical protein